MGSIGALNRFSSFPYALPLAAIITNYNAFIISKNASTDDLYGTWFTTLSARHHNIIIINICDLRNALPICCNVINRLLRIQLFHLVHRKFHLGKQIPSIHLLWNYEIFRLVGLHLSCASTLSMYRCWNFSWAFFIPRYFLNSCHAF